MFANICLSWLNNLIRKLICCIRKCFYYFYKYIGINSSICDSREQDQGKGLFSGVVGLCLFVGLGFFCLFEGLVHLLIYFQWVNQSGVNELGNHSALDTALPPVFRNHHKTVSPWHCQVLKCLRALGRGDTELVVQAQPIIADLGGFIAHGL